MLQVSTCYLERSFNSNNGNKVTFFFLLMILNDFKKKYVKYFKQNFDNIEIAQDKIAQGQNSA